MYNPITGTGAGTAPAVNIPWPFLDKSHVNATVNGAPVSFTWTGPSQITFSAVVAGGASWEVSRSTPTNTPLVDFTDGAVITEGDLDKNRDQALYAIEELSQPTVNGTPLAATSGAGLVGFDKAASYSSTSLGGQMRRLTDTIRFWGDFGIAANGTTDDTAAVQSAFDWLAPGKVLFMPGADIKITAMLNLGDGTSTSLPTKYGFTIVWGGEVGNTDGLIRPVSDANRALKAGTRFIWAGAAGGQMMKWNGFIGARMIGALVLDGMDFNNAGTGASYGLESRSVSGLIADSIIAVNWKSGGRGILFDTWPVTTIGGLLSPVTSSKNRIARLIASSPDAQNSESIRLDGYRAANGQDFTVSQIGYMEVSVNGTAAKGLVLGYTDNIKIDQLIAILYRAIVGTPYGIYIDGSAGPPWAFPSQLSIEWVALSGAIGVGGSTPAKVTIGTYLFDDGALVPSAAGLVVLNWDKSATPFPFTVATLPATLGPMSRAWVSDANATTFGSVVAGGGTNKVPVYFDGTNWRIG